MCDATEVQSGLLSPLTKFYPKEKIYTKSIQQFNNKAIKQFTKTPPPTPQYPIPLLHLPSLYFLHHRSSWYCKMGKPLQ